MAAPGPPGMGASSDASKAAGAAADEVELGLGGGATRERVHLESWSFEKTEGGVMFQAEARPPLRRVGKDVLAR